MLLLLMMNAIVIAFPLTSLLYSLMVPYVTVLASIASTSWEGLIQTDMTPSNKANFLLASLLNTISGITILVSLQYLLTRSFVYKLRAFDAYGRLEEAERPLVKLYGVTFLSVLFRSWAMAIANLLTSLVTNIWIWVALYNGVNLKDEIRNTCSHVGYSLWLKGMSIVYSFVVSAGNHPPSLVQALTVATIIHLLIYYISLNDQSLPGWAQNSECGAYENKTRLGP